MEPCCGFCFANHRNACDLSDKHCWGHHSQYSREIQDSARKLVGPFASSEALSKTCAEVAAKQIPRGDSLRGHRYKNQQE